MGADEPNAWFITDQRRNHMTMTDPIADMLTRVRNGQSAGKATVSMPSSKKLVEIVRIMEQEGYIQRFDVIDGEPRATLEITLKYGPKKAKGIGGEVIAYLW